MNTVTLPVILTDRSSRRTEGTVRLRTWDAKERTGRAMKLFVACWGGALFFLFIPIAHFIATPGLLIAGVLVALKVSRQHDVVLGGEGKCPSCSKPFEIVRSANQWPLSDQCGDCQTPVTIEKRPAPNA